jgi:hypothetical protein
MHCNGNFMDDITVEQLQTQIQGAAFCASVTLTSRDLTPLLNLAVRRAGTYNSLIITRLQKGARAAEVKLTGDEVRMILDLALQAKLGEENRRPSLKVVHSTKID